MKKKALFVLCVVLGITLFAVCAGARTLPGGESFICVRHNWTVVNIKKATCTQAGSANYACSNSNCDATKQETLAALGHDYQQVGVLAPTCTKEGAYYLQCTRCNDEKTEKRPATGNHNWVLDNINRDDVECVAGGIAYYHCTVCMDQKNESVPATGHKWNAVAAIAANCVSPKIVTYECSTCGESKTETEGSKAAHSWNETYYEPATCAADGYKSYKCAVCSQTKTDTIPATGKCTWGNWIVVTTASCNQDGLKVAECTVCGDTKKEVIPSEGVHDYRTTATKDPACETDGSKTYTCSKCGKTKTETLQATGHNWKDGSVIKAATCTEDGKASSVCTKCNATDNNRTIPKLGHKWSDWKVTKEATEKATGSKERTCTVCSKKETEVIPKKTTNKPASSSSLEAEYGTVEVFTTSGKVNLRSGPSKDNKRVTQVEKRNTCLGELLEAKADSKGVVWFKVKYKGKTGWITSDYAKAVVGELDGSTRHIEGKETELTNLYLKSVREAQDALMLEDDYRYEIYETEVANEAVLVCGNDYVQVIELTGEGYTIYGVKVGDKIKDAKTKFKKANLVTDYESAGEYLYNIICSQDSLSINESGFDGTLTVVVEDGKVASMCLEANSPAE